MFHSVIPNILLHKKINKFDSQIPLFLFFLRVVCEYSGQKFHICQHYWAKIIGFAGVRVDTAFPEGKALG